MLSLKMKNSIFSYETNLGAVYPVWMLNAAPVCDSQLWSHTEHME